MFFYRNRLGGRAFQVGCASMLMFFYIVVNHVGLLWMYTAEGGVKQLTSVNKNTVILLAAISVIVTFAYILADLLVRQLFPYQRMVIRQRLAEGNIHYQPLFLLLCFTGTIAVLKFLQGSPLLMLITGDALAANQARLTEYTTHSYFLGIKPSYIKIFFEIATFSMILVLIKFMATFKFKYLVLYTLCAVIVLLDSMSNVSKGGMLIPIYQFWMVYAVIYQRRHVVNKMVIWGVLLTVFGISSVSAFVMANEQVNYFYPFERLFLGNLLPQYVAVDSFSIDNLLWGSTLPSWWTFGNHEQFLLDVFVWKELMQWSPGLPFYTAPSSFVADAFVNFHLIGVFLISIVVFFLLRLIDVWLTKVRSELTYTALLVYSSLYFSYWATGGSLNFLFDYYYFCVLMFSLFLYKKYRLR